MSEPNLAPRGWLCVECGGTYPSSGATQTCPGCHVPLIELGPNFLSDRVQALAGAALLHRRQRIETWGVLAGTGVGLVAGLLAASHRSVNGLLAPILIFLLALWGAGLAWLIVPSLWSRAVRRRIPGLFVAGVRPGLRLVSAAALVVIPAVAASVGFFSMRQDAVPVLAVRSTVAPSQADVAALVALGRDHAGELAGCHGQTSVPRRGEWFAWNVLFALTVEGALSIEQVLPAKAEGADCIRRVMSQWRVAPHASGVETDVWVSYVVRRSLVSGDLGVEGPRLATILPWSKEPMLPPLHP
jgi:hypothetical protein